MSTSQTQAEAKKPNLRQPMMCYTRVEAEHLLHIAQWSFKQAEGKSKKNLRRRRMLYHSATKALSQAGYTFKLVLNELDKASKIFKDLAIVQLRIHHEKEAARNYFEAARCAAECKNFKRAVRLYEKSTVIYLDLKGFEGKAADLMETAGEIYEKELHDLSSAMDCYKRAARQYKLQNPPLQVRRCELKVASVAVQMQDYVTAAYYYEWVSNDEMKCPLLELFGKEHLLFAALCVFLAEPEKVASAVDHYETEHPSFVDSKQDKFIRAILKAMDEGDRALWDQEIEGFEESVHKLDPTCKDLLLLVKEAVPKSQAWFSLERSNTD